MYVKIRRHQHTRVHAHTGPRRHTRAPACHRHQPSHGLSAGAGIPHEVALVCVIDQGEGGERGAARIFLGLEPAARLGL